METFYYLFVNLSARFINTLSYSAKTALLRSRLRSELRAWRGGSLGSRFLHLIGNCEAGAVAAVGVAEHAVGLVVAGYLLGLGIEVQRAAEPV